jgi:hypothetical protein
LAAFPSLAKYASVQGTFKSNDPMVTAIVAVPVVIWDILPENRAISFIAFVGSVNLLDYGEDL